MYITMCLGHTCSHQMWSTNLLMQVLAYLLGANLLLKSYEVVDMPHIIFSAYLVAIEISRQNP